jgi:quercetin dioxygenase-like cupin family protein
MKIHRADSIRPAEDKHGEGVSVRWVISRRDGAPNFAMRVIEIEAGGATPHHDHWNEHEVYILEGEGVVKSADGDRELVPGDVIYVAPDEIHQFVNTGSEPFKFICVVPLDEKKS